ncbi:MAG: transaldolase [Chlamydiales bacterium]
MNVLEQLQQWTVIVSDTGEIDEIKKYKPTDATTNPTLILQAVDNPKYSFLLNEAIAWGKKAGIPSDALLDTIITKLSVNFGIEISKTVPGRVSTEVDARLSFDKQGSISQGQRFIELYEQAGVSRDRILIKLASTWEGILAARELEKQGIHCNMTLLFDLYQAIACANAGVTLISPFVGRISDWYKQKERVDSYSADIDPGVKSVLQIYNYYKKHHYKTEIMGASFRNIDQILALSGCDLLTISPKLLQSLTDTTTHITRRLDLESAQKSGLSKITLNESTFRWKLNENAMATEKLAEGIRNFATDTIQLRKRISKMI